MFLNIRKSGKNARNIIFWNNGKSLHFIYRSIFHEDPAFVADDPSLTRDEYFTMAQAYVWFKDIKKNYPPLYNAFHRYFLAHYKAENLLKYLESQLENKK